MTRIEWTARIAPADEVKTGHWASRSGEHAMSKVEVRESRIKGTGVFATRPIGRGEVILPIDDSMVINEDDPVLGSLIGAEPDHCDYLPDGTVVLMQEPERYINHSCAPNVHTFTVDKNRFLLAMRDISAGEELVFDYALGEVGGDWLDCRCGAPSCRGRHRSDFFTLPRAQQLEYLPYLSSDFVRVHRLRILRLLRGGAEGKAPTGHKGAGAET